jgi:hypothetical protein
VAYTSTGQADTSQWLKGKLTMLLASWVPLAAFVDLAGGCHTCQPLFDSMALVSVPTHAAMPEVVKVM